MRSAASRRDNRRDAVFAAGAGAAMLLLFLLVRDSLVDDAYITLDYARNLARDFHWGLIPGEVSNTATSPLNVALLAAAATAARPFTTGVDAVAAVGIVCVALAALMAWSWTRIVRALEVPLVAAVVGVALVLADPFLLSSIGLEMLLAAALLTTLLAVALEGRAGWFGVVAGLTLLARLDLIVIVLAVALFTPAVRARWRRALAATALVAGPWFVFSWLYFGSAVPDTLLIKTAQRGIWGEWSFFSGPDMYSSGLAGRPVAVALAFAPAVLGAVALLAFARLRRFGPAFGLGASGVAYYLVLSLIDPGPFHWYYVPPIVALSTFLAIAAGTWVAERRALVPALALGAAALLAAGAVAHDLKQGVPWDSPVFTTNFANAESYERVGRAVRARVGDAAVASFGEIGTVAYFCDCRIVDVYSDRGETVQLIDRELDRSGALEPLLRLNYLLLDRDRKPARPDYYLSYRRGPAPEGPEVWNVRSRWTGVGHVRLIPAPGAP